MKKLQAPSPDMPGDEDELPEKKKRVLRLPEVMDRTGLKRSTIYKRIKFDKFPRQVCLGGDNVGWIEDEIDGWIDECINKSRQDTKPPTNAKGE